jgi:hypothetical protein
MGQVSRYRPQISVVHKSTQSGAFADHSKTVGVKNRSVQQAARSLLLSIRHRLAHAEPCVTWLRPSMGLTKIRKSSDARRLTETC